MAVLKVYKYPHPVLRSASVPVPVNTPQWHTEMVPLIQDLKDTLYAFPGAVGLAAPQTGNAVRIILIDVTASSTQDGLRVLVNPEIVSQSRTKWVREGCLSFPEYLANTRRATRVTVAAYNEAGDPIEFAADGLEAIAIQHELDHLDGVLLIDRVGSLKTDMIRRRGS
jgi:peptide deformylase